MNQKTKITIGSLALLGMLSVKAFGADAPTFRSVVPARDAQDNVAGLSKGEQALKVVASPVATQNPASKGGETLASSAGGSPSPQSVSSPNTWVGPSFADLEKLRSENALLAEQLKNAELKNKITAQGGVPNFGGSSNYLGRDNPATSKLPSSPRVVMIAGAEGNYRANILLPNGQSITASTGSTVPGIRPSSWRLHKPLVLRAPILERSLKTAQESLLAAKEIFGNPQEKRLVFIRFLITLLAPQDGSRQMVLMEPWIFVVNLFGVGPRAVV